MTRWLIALLIVLIAAVLGLWALGQARAPIGETNALDYAARPAALIVDVPRLDAALSTSPYVVSGGEARTVWIVGHRSCRPCESFLRATLDDLRAADADVRVAFFAPEDASAEERSTLAEIGARRSWSTLRSWISASERDFYARTGFAPATDPVRRAILEAGRRTRDEIEAVMAANGLMTVYPLVFWRGEDGDWMVAAGDTARSRNAVLAAAGAE
ncbi:MAG: hypothetical protein PVI23_13260 [Maricaulaceae bacterium]|jgi:hypothetical protein